MATTILGIDLGSYSVKVARLDAGFRSKHLIGIEEQRLPLAEPPGEGGPAAAEELLQRQLRTLSPMLHNRKGETSVVALGGEVTLRLLEMPFADAKKVAQALPFELAGQLLTDPEDQIVDQLLARPLPARLSAVGGGAAGEGEAGSLWLAACAPREVVQARLAALSDLGLDPRLCAATALAGAALLAEGWRSRAKGEPSAASEPPEFPLWVVDLGHRTTHICAVGLHPGRRGQVLVPFARTIARGGEQLTQSLTRALNIDIERAEELKHSSSLTAVDGAGEPRVAAVLREALRPLLRDLRQTLAAYVARYGDPPRCLYLTGGTAQLGGLAELLGEELGVPAKPLLPEPGAPWLQHSHRDLRASWSALSSDDAAARSQALSGPVLVRHWPTGATAVGLSLLGASATAPQLNFRKGELSYRTNYAFVRERAPYLVGFAAALLSCIVIWAWASLKVMEQESGRLLEQLKTESKAVFGEERVSGQQVSAELQSMLAADKGSGQSVPTVTALDVLEDISKAAPKSNAAGPARLDVTELSIRAKKTELKATAGSAQYVDDLATALGKLPCFKNVVKGKVLTVRNVGPDNKPFDVKQFSLEITTTCP